MARMFPERLPAEVKSEAERRLFDIFKSEFSDDFVVFHGVRWLARRRGGGATDGEADFVVAHPHYGVLVLEVKGGGISRDAQSGRWTSTDREGVEHEIKDPFRQASGSMFALRSNLRESEVTRQYAYPLAWAAAFPDIYIDFELGPDALPEAVFDLPKVRALKQSVVDALRLRCGDQDGPGPEAIEALVTLLGRSWQVEATVGATLDQQERIIRLLTEEQFALLDFLGARRRALISGCAGSGKTMLAVEKARRLVGEGQRVLLTCYNQNLAAWVAAQLPQADVRHFHRLCRDFAAKAGIDLSRRPGEGDELFFGRFPDALLDATKFLDDRYDAIIVDEGQDFEEEWWVALASLLEDPDDGIVYIFYDDNQMLYDRARAYPISEPPFVLTRNCRNTRRIHDVVMYFYRARESPSCLGPEGVEPQLYEFSQGGERRGVEALIDKLVGKEQVRPADIALLTRRSRERSIWSTPPRSSAWTATWDLRQCAGQVICSTIHGFKGLERPVVIVSELSDVDPAEQAELLYVAFSRARDYLIVVGLRNLERLAERL
ncbi:MAG: nerd domain protein [Chloroflexi bacterium]|nr:MAG: nerd domain protein [Chloroflexota bacterium]